MAVVVDYANSINLSENGVTASTISVTCAGTVNFLLVAAAWRVGSVSPPSGFTYNGIALTMAPLQAKGGTTNVTYWYLVNPPLGTFSLIGTFGSGGTSAFAAFPMSGVHTTSPIMSENTQFLTPADTTAPSVAVNAHSDWRVATSNDVYFATAMLDNAGVPSTTTGTNQTNRVRVVNGTKEFMVDSIPGANAPSFTWSSSATGFTYWSAMAIAIRGTGTTIAVAPTARPDLFYNSLARSDITASPGTLSINVSVAPGDNFLTALTGIDATPLSGVTAVTWNGTALTKQGSDYSNISFETVSLWYLSNPTPGTGPLIITYASGVNCWTAHAQAWSGVNLSAPFGTPVSNNASATVTPSVTATGATANDVYLGFEWSRSNGIANAGGANQLPLATYQYGGYNANSSYILGTNSGAFSWTLNAPNYWQTLAIPIKGPLTTMVGAATDTTSANAALTTATRATPDAANVLGFPVAGNTLVWTSPNATVASNDNLLVVVVYAENGTGDLPPSSVTYGGAAMTMMPFLAQDLLNHLCNTSYWYLQNPTAGAAPVVATFGATSRGALVSVPFSNAHPTAPVMQSFNFGYAEYAINTAFTVGMPTDWRALQATDCALGVIGFGGGGGVGSAVTTRASNQTSLYASAIPTGGSDGISVDMISGTFAGAFSWNLTTSATGYFGVTTGLGIRGAGSGIATPAGALPTTFLTQPSQFGNLGASPFALTNVTVFPGDNLLTVAAGINASTLAGYTGMTYNGVALTKLSSNANTTHETCELWYLVNPPVGSWPLSASFGLTGLLTVSLFPTSWSGVNTAAPFGTVAVANSPGATTTVAVAATGGGHNDTYYGFMMGQSNVPTTTGTGQTSFFGGGKNGGGEGADSAYIAGTGSGAFGWLTTGGGNRWEAVAVAIKGYGAILTTAASDPTSGTGALTTAIILAAGAADAVTAAASLLTYASITLTSPLYTGVGSVADPNFWTLYNSNPPIAGDTLFYDPTYITILPDGEIVSTTNNCSALVQFNDGTGLAIGLIVITPFMVGIAVNRSTAAGSLAAAVQLVASASTLVSAVGNLTTKMVFASNAANVVSATAQLTTAIQLVASAIDTSTGAGLIGSGVLMAGGGTTATTASGALSTKISMLSAATSATTAAASLTTKIPLAGNALTTSSAAAVLQARVVIAGNALSTTSSIGDLSAQIRLASAANNLITALGTLTAQIQFSSNALDVVSGAANLKTRTQVYGDAADITTAMGALATQVRFAGAAKDLTTASGSLDALILLFSNALSVTSAAADLTINASPAGLYATDPNYLISGQRTYWSQKFSTIGPTEQRVIGFDFSDDLTPTETLAGVIAVIVVCSAGTDITPTLTLHGPPSFSRDKTQALQPVWMLQQDSDYYFTATCSTTNPQKVLARFGLLQCRK